MNIQEVKDNYRIEEIIGRTISLKPQGTEMVGNCIFHNDNHASLKVSKRLQTFKCFPCGASGDMFDFYSLQGIEINEAKQIITNGTIIHSDIKHIPEPPKPKYVSVVCNQENLPNPWKFTHTKYENNPSRVDAYHDKDGNVISYACRFDLPEGKKDVLPLTFKQKISSDGLPIGSPFWKWEEWGKPRPLYNLYELYLRPNDPVLLVEGEKAASAGKMLFPEFVVMTWPQGKDNVKHADWSVLEGRVVYLWPDNDLAGILAMFGGWDQNEISKKYTRFKGACEYFNATFFRIHNKPELPKKWDVADADWSIEQANEYLLENMSTDLPIISAHAPNEIPVPLPPIDIPEFITEEPSVTSIRLQAEPAQLPTAPEQISNNLFECLGFEHDGKKQTYVFYVYRSNTLIKLTPSEITPSNLIQLADVNYWEDKYPGRSGKYNIVMAANHLAGECLKKGIFNPNKIRGRGAWIDEGLPVVHCGDTLIVDGAYKQFRQHKSKFLYQAGHELGFNLTKPLDKHNAASFLKILERLQWSRDINSRLLAGWVVIAPLCGALRWRPHVWLTGPSGSGKSWVMNSMVQAMMKEMAIQAQSETTEAGIRQTLRNDALPVLFDEAEAEGPQGLQRIQSNVSLARAASTEDSGKIIKGSAGGSANEYSIRSCFMFSSIGVNVNQRADISRITVIELQEDRRPVKDAEWRNTLDMYNEIVTPEYIAAFQSRSVMMLPTILKNTDTFAKAIASHLKNQRTGDQISAMLAGAYSLLSDDLISYDDAVKWVQERNWDTEKLSENTKDEVQVLESIIGSEIQIEIGGFRYTRTVGEAILIARGDLMPDNDAVLTESCASAALRRNGIRVDGFKVLFAYNSKYLSTCLKGTAYEKNYHTMLGRLETAEKIDKTTFGAGMASRAIRIDSQVIFGTYGNPGMIRIEPDEQTQLKIN